MDRDAIRRFAQRDRRPVEALRSAYWAQRYQEGGAEVCWRIAQGLREHMRGVRATWPDKADREEDWRHHVELKRRLDRTARALARR